MEASSETRARLDQYQALLLKWQKAVNLVSGKTLDEVWDRHFVDSAQLLPLIPAGKKTLFDIGSGAGFPGLVLAIMNPALDVHLIESDHKKCTFLSTVSRETKTPVTIHSERVENMSKKIVPAIVTARALASLDKLMAYCLPWAERNPALIMLFLKGEKAEAEIKEARKKFSFGLQKHQSQTMDNAAILEVSNLCITSR